MLDAAKLPREYMTLGRPTSLSVSQIAREKVRKARSDLEDFRHGFGVAISDCRQRIEETDNQIGELRELREILGGSLEDDDRVRLQKLLAEAERLQKELEFHLDWENRQRRNFELPRRISELERAYSHAVRLLYKDVTRRLASARKEGEDLYALADILEAAADAGELIREGFAEFGWFEIPDFKKLGLEKLALKCPPDCSWPAVPDWDELTRYGMDVLKRKVQ